MLLSTAFHDTTNLVQGKEHAQSDSVVIRDRGPRNDHAVEAPTPHKLRLEKLPSEILLKIVSVLPYHEYGALTPYPILCPRCPPED
jgi:hypothetical protein